MVTHPSRFWSITSKTRSPALLALVVCWTLTTADGGTIGLARFGTCGPAGTCTATVIDNVTTGPFPDLNPAVGITDFDVLLGDSPDGFYSVRGRLIETIVRNAAGRVVAINLTLTETTLIGLGGGIGSPPVTLGQIAAISSVPLTSLFGVAGGAIVNGQYQNASGIVGFADLLVQARLGGALLGLVNPPAAVGAASPVPFSGADFGAFPFPVSNLLIGTLDFGVGAGDGFFLPTSGDVFAFEIPEPAGWSLIGSGLVAMIFLQRRRRRVAAGQPDN
jgi:hypothetical protein